MFAFLAILFRYIFNVSGLIKVPVKLKNTNNSFFLFTSVFNCFIVIKISTHLSLIETTLYESIVLGEFSLNSIILVEFLSKVYFIYNFLSIKFIFSHIKANASPILKPVKYINSIKQFILTSRGVTSNDCLNFFISSIDKNFSRFF